MPLELVIIGAFVVIYLTACGVFLSGPFAVFARFRELLTTAAPETFGEFLTCPWCVGFWAAIPVVVAFRLDLLLSIFLVLAYAAIAGLVVERSLNI